MINGVYDTSMKPSFGASAYTFGVAVAMTFWSVTLNGESSFDFFIPKSDRENQPFHYGSEMRTNNLIQ